MNYREYYEQCIGEKLSNGEHVHHLDSNRKNNHISNLVALPKELHYRFHNVNVRIERFLYDIKNNREFKMTEKYAFELETYSKIRNDIFDYEMNRDGLIYSNNDIDIYDGNGLNNFPEILK